MHCTILSHISTLISCMNKVDGVPVGCHLMVAKWVLVDRSLNPPRQSLIPLWDLSVVLAASVEESFELLHHAAHKDLAVSEIHALCIDPPFLIQDPRSFLSDIHGNGPFLGP